MPTHHPDIDRALRVLTQTLAKWLGRPPSTVRAWCERGVLPEPEVVTAKVVLHDVAAVLAALAERVPHGANGYEGRKARKAARRAALPADLEQPADVARDQVVAEQPADVVGDQVVAEQPADVGPTSHAALTAR